MSNIQIISDSSCDLSKESISNNSIRIVPFSVTLDDGFTYLKEGEEISVEKFYSELHEKEIFPKTSLPAVKDYIDVFKETLDKGDDVVCICLSSKFSGSYQSAVNAMEIIKDEQPKGKIVVIDSRQATCGQGLLVLLAKELANKGFGVEEIEKIVNDNRSNCVTYFTLSSLEYLQKGGRLGKGTALIGSILNINPVLLLDKGELIPVGKVRGRKKAIANICELSKEHIGENNLKDYQVKILTAEQDIDLLNDTLKSTLNTDQDFEKFQIGVTIGAHTGYTAVGITVSKFDIPS